MKYANLVFWVVVWVITWTVHWPNRWYGLGFIAAACAVSIAAKWIGGFFDPAADPNITLAELLAPIRARYNLPALAATIVTTDGALDLAATGVRKAGTSVLATTEDLWHLGSCAKAMTALLAGTFVAEGKLAWDDKVVAFFPEMVEQLPAPMREVTIAQLLSHHAGLTENYPRELAGRLAGPIIAQRRTVAEWMLTSPAQAPGRHRYSNGGYVVVGAILEKLGGASWEELMRARVFAPLGMESAGFGGTGTAGEIDQPWPHLADGTPTPSNGPAMDNLPYMGPAGTMHCSMADWAKFLADQMRGGSGQAALLPASIYAAMQTPAGKSNYGFGWIIVSRRWARGKMLSHAGTNTMNYAASWLGPRCGYGVLVCCNQGGGKLGRMANEVAEARGHGRVIRFRVA
jgi:CubicO group peptidase (beta-lactamase class C family)